MLLWPIVFVIILYIIYWQMYAKRKGFPPGPTPLPFLGNAFQIDNGNIHNTLLKWKKQYGGVFTIWIPEPTIIVSDYESLKEYFLKKGNIFAGRPRLNFIDDLLGGPYGLVMNDNAWYKSQRQFAIQVLRFFGMGRPIIENTIIDQAKKLVTLLEDTKSEPIELTPYLTTAVGNVIFQIVFGYVREHSDPELHMVKRNIEAIVDAVTGLLGYLVEISPKFKCLDSLLGNEYANAMEKNKEILDFLRKEINMHKQTVDYEAEPRDYIDTFLQEMHQRAKNNNICEFTEHQLLMSVWDIFAAGLITTSTAPRAFILYMILHPDVQAKIHSEIDSVIGRNNLIKMSDQPRLHYLNATIQEVQRLAISFSLNAQRVVLEDVQMGEYKIPKGTLVIPQFQTVHMDDEVFPDPERFDSERHLDENGCFRKDDHIMPFSIGKRACLGESLGRMEVFLLLAHLLQKFEFRSAHPNTSPPLEFTKGILRGPKPFLCRAISRQDI